MSNGIDQIPLPTMTQLLVFYTLFLISNLGKAKKTVKIMSGYENSKSGGSGLVENQVRPVSLIISINHLNNSKTTITKLALAVLIKVT